ncbi:MAG: YHYH protein [Myxococcota bacterium]
MNTRVWVGSVLLLVGCSSNAGDNGGAGASGGSAGAGGVVDITNAVFVVRDPDCAAYSNTYGSEVVDIQRDLLFDGDVTISNDGDSCTLVSNNIPNHDFDDATASFATDVAAVNQAFTVPRMPSLASEPTALSQQVYDGVMLNGVPIDVLSAGCYDPDSPMADANGDVAIGCNADVPWLLDPLGTEFKFGADANNAHTQPDGAYHYHGNPNAMFDDMPGAQGSPVIGFAADGFPIYGSFFLDPATNTVREAVSGYTLRSGDRPEGDGNPGGPYDGRYVADWEFTDAGDLDECNGMEVDGQYGYYVIDAFPWILRCLSGTPDPSFQKGMAGP